MKEYLVRLYPDDIQRLVQIANALDTTLSGGLRWLVARAFGKPPRLCRTARSGRRKRYVALHEAQDWRGHTIGVNLTEEEHADLALLAKAEGMTKSRWLRRELARASTK